MRWCKHSESDGFSISGPHRLADSDDGMRDSCSDRNVLDGAAFRDRGLVQH